MPRALVIPGRIEQAATPALTAQVGQVNLFIHDSLHTGKNVLFEMEQVASVMPSGAVMVVDDIGSHNGFPTFAAKHPDFRTMACASADGLGVFGIAVKGGYRAVPAPARTKGSTRYGTWVASEIRVEERTTPSAETIASITR